MLYLPHLAPPGIISGRPKFLHGILGAITININVCARTISATQVKNVASPTIDTVLFTQLIAKIAHAFASAELLRENFEPLLVDFINTKLNRTDNDDRRYYFVGGDFAIEKPDEFYHSLGLFLKEHDGKTYVVAKVRLLAFMGTPTYYAVVGIVPDDKRAAAMARLSGNNSRTHDR